MLECKPLNEWARSSMAEQWPFKPVVEGSSPPALTKKVLLYRRAFLFVVRPHRRDVIRVSRAHRKVLLCRRAFLFVVRPHRRDVIRVPRAHKKSPSLPKGFFVCCASPQKGCYSSPPALTGKSFFTEGLFVCYASPHSSPRTDGYKAFSKIPCNSPSVKGIGFPL